MRAPSVAALGLSLLLVGPPSPAQPLAEGTCAAAPEGGTCGDAGASDPPAAARGGASPSTERGTRATLRVYWGVGCAHCERARPIVERLAAGRRARVEWVEVRQDARGRARFEAEVRRLGLGAAGVPLFVAGDRALVGFGPRGEAELVALLDGAPRAARAVELPLFGAVDPGAISLPAFTLLVGLADGFNPCAFYVLVVLLGVLLHAKSRARLALYGGVFVAMSGVVYFLFMTAWLGVFVASGVARWVTTLLGLALVGMGAVNLKELVWFKKGVSLMIPERAKPALHRRMRAVAATTSLPAALAGITTLAALVNLVELGCTLGLPAMYTRVLALRADVGAAGRLAYLALYNVAYVVPLAAIVALSAVTLRRMTLSEGRAKALKALSGVLLVLFGVVFLLRPELLR